MPNSKDLRRRIRSIKNTSQITKAMEMVAATKMRKAQNQAVNGRPYNHQLKRLIDQLINSSTNVSHPLLKSNDSTQQLIILLTTDKSLCGALNTNLFRLISHDFDNQNTQFITVGAKGRTFLARTNQTLLADFPNHDLIDETYAKQIRQTVLEQFYLVKAGSVAIVFPNFISTLTQSPTIFPLLPIDPTKFLTFLLDEQSDQPKKDRQSSKNNSLFEPNLDQILEYSLLHFIDVSIYQALLETKASEHSARMIAMQNATKNAKDLVSDLTLTYNQIRQDAITNELLENSSAGLALE